jgi:hypothetical protein
MRIRGIKSTTFLLKSRYARHFRRPTVLPPENVIGQIINGITQKTRIPNPGTTRPTIFSSPFLNKLIGLRCHISPHHQAEKILRRSEGKTLYYLSYVNVQICGRSCKSNAVVEWIILRIPHTTKKIRGVEITNSTYVNLATLSRDLWQAHNSPDSLRTLW